MYHALWKDVYPRMSSAGVLRGRRERVFAVRRKREVTAAERVDEVWALQRGGGLLWRIAGSKERAARQETDRLRYCRLEEAAELRMCAAMGG